MNSFFNAEELLESGKSLVKQTSDQVVKQTNSTINAATNQVTGDQGTNEVQNAAGGAAADDNTKDFIKDLYGVSNNNSNPQAVNSNVQSQNSGQTPQTLDDAKKLADARKLLMEQHMSTYYRPTFERVDQEEENVADKLEKEKQEEAKKMEELQKEQKKKMPINVSNAHKTEKNPGASG